ncbi:holo-ACP synthase [Alkalibacillus silvisoli]|uniref:Holo-[acyl-carrier-protein] synthase n=1 Tax=Alkalibacillus silvisoli TaxID=392823 RepID=A0ABN0ZM50_9BACI
MIKGTGIDITELDRIKNLLEKQPRFIQRILTEKEQERYYSYSNYNRQVEYLAGRFAAKEAYSKAMGCGIGKELSFQSVEIISTHHGQPQFLLNNERMHGVHVSISHSKDYVVAQVIIEQV